MPTSLSDDAFHSIVDAAPDAILLVDAHGTIVYANARTEALFGYAVDELLGERVESLVPEHEREIHQINREVYAEHPSARAMGVGLRLAGRRRDGSQVPVEISLSPYRAADSLYVVAIVRDVTDLRRQEEVLRRSEVRLRLVTENAADMIFRYRVEPDPAFEYVSAAAAAVTGYTPEDFYAHPELCFSVVVDDDRHALSSAFSEPDPVTVSVRATRKDGALRWFEYRIQRGLDQRGATVVEGVIRDVTERRTEEEERHRLLAEIETQLERERIAGDLHDDVIQSVYSLGLALHGDRLDEGVSKESALTHAIEGLNAVIADLRAYMHDLSGQHVGTVTREAFRPRIEALVSAVDGPDWTVAIPDDLALDDGSERHLYLLIKELASNVTRHAQARNASITVRPEDSDLVLEVSDDGTGYDPSQVPETSFGLRSVDHRVGMLGAQVETDTAVGQGTRVRVRIPRESIAAPTRVSSASAPA